MSVSYTFISKFYGLLDTICFRKNQNNPRFILLDKIPNNSSTLLEVAIGTAENSILIAKNKPKINIIGIDLSDEILKIAQKNIIKNNIGNIKLMKMDGMNMAFENETFDFIVISLLLHELQEDIANKILKECIRVLKHDGKIYIIEWEEPKKKTQKVIFSIIKLLEPFANKEFKQFLIKDMSIYFNKNGLQIKSIEHGDYSKIIEIIKSATCT